VYVKKLFYQPDFIHIVAMWLDKMTYRLNICGCKKSANATRQRYTHNDETDNACILLERPEMHNRCNYQHCIEADILYVINSYHAMLVVILRVRPYTLIVPVLKHDGSETRSELILFLITA